MPIADCCRSLSSILYWDHLTTVICTSDRPITPSDHHAGELSEGKTIWEHCAFHPACDALVSRDMFDRKQQNRNKCSPEIARDAAMIGSVQIYTQATCHTDGRIDRRKAVKERSPDQGRCCDVCPIWSTCQQMAASWASQLGCNG